MKESDDEGSDYEGSVSLTRPITGDLPWQSLPRHDSYYQHHYFVVPS